MIVVFVFGLIGAISTIIGITVFIKFGLVMSSWFLPSAGEILQSIVTLVGAIILLLIGIVCFITASKKYKKLRLLAIHKFKSNNEDSTKEFDMLSMPSTSISGAASKIVAYCFSQDTFLKPELQEISTTLSSLSGLFKNVTAVMERRFSGGLTSTKYQRGIESLRLAVLARIDNQVMQLCAVDENDLKRKASTDIECDKSINKLTQYIQGTQALLNKTVGLVSRMALEAMDCDLDVLEHESSHVLELVQELKEYK